MAILWDPRTTQVDHSVEERYPEVARNATPSGSQKSEVFRRALVALEALVALVAPKND